MFVCVPARLRDSCLLLLLVTLTSTAAYITQEHIYRGHCLCVSNSSQAVPIQQAVAMCFKVECQSCSKPTWQGCGRHIDTVRRTEQRDEVLGTEAGTDKPPDTLPRCVPPAGSCQRPCC